MHFSFVCFLDVPSSTAVVIVLETFFNDSLYRSFIWTSGRGCKHSRLDRAGSSAPPSDCADEEDNRSNRQPRRIVNPAIHYDRESRRPYGQDSVIADNLAVEGAGLVSLCE